MTLSPDFALPAIRVGHGNGNALGTNPVNVDSLGLLPVPAAQPHGQAVDPTLATAGTWLNSINMSGMDHETFPFDWTWLWDESGEHGHLSGDARSL